MATSAVRRRPPVWVVAVLGAVVALAAVAIFGSTVQAQQSPTALSISKTVNPTVVTVGQNQVYTIRISNNTGARATNVQMRDPLPANVRFLRASTSLQRPGSCGLNAQRTVVCNLGNLPTTRSAGAQVTIRIYVRTTAVGRYVNRAFVTHTNVALGAEQPQRNSDTATHRAVKDNGGKKRCGVKAVGAKPNAKACVGGVKAIAKR
jgi:uncharacterized repeat protein (TIGR01451 family)